jgi:phosphoribosylaminoimidazolecarboxamide formyltransferase / IMP cyclohydrolase
VNLIKIKRAIVSVSDKSGIIDFVKQLQRWNIDIISTGGTLQVLHEAGISARSISDITGFPEILDGRVKTLHPKVHAALLAVPDNSSHSQQLKKFDIDTIDLVVVNLYPFEQAIEKSDISLDQAVEQIDIGGPTMIRAAAKNFKYKTVIINPARYNSVISELEKNDGAISYESRLAMAKEVFIHTSKYDTAIAKYLSTKQEREAHPILPNVLSYSLNKTEDLRYGENPHQAAALYGDFYKYFQKLHGKELSYNNIVDIQAAAELIEEFTEPTVVIIKHTNPCGVGSAAALSESYSKALSTDPKSAFGGIVATNKPLDIDTAQLIDKIFTEVVIAPFFPDIVLEFLKKKKDRRLIMQISSIRCANNFIVKNIAGGLIAQTPNIVKTGYEQLKVVTKRHPNEEEHKAMMFARYVVKHVKSNAIVYARSDRNIGIGAGQMSRFDSSRIAVQKAYDAGLDLRKTVVASDAFFPFADGLLEAVKAGATAVIQPGGSIRDDEVIKAADENNIAMIFTGIRHFKH